MIRRYLTAPMALVILALLAVPAVADRPVTPEERAKLAAALQALGCSAEAEEMEYEDDGEFEVDDARCADGRKYDFEFDREYRLIKQELD